MTSDHRLDCVQADEHTLGPTDRKDLHVHLDEACRVREHAVNMQLAQGANDDG